MPKIPGGYICLARKIKDSDILHKPPLYLKLWIWMLLNATKKPYGTLLPGQLFTSIPKMIEAMTYYAGRRPMIPTKKEIWSVLEYLRNPVCESFRKSDEKDTKGTTAETMIVTTKVTHGILITICNYEFYQEFKNYESNGEGNGESNDEKGMKRIAREQYKQEEVQEEQIKEGGDDPVYVSIKLKGSDSELIVRESYVRELEKTYDRLDVRQVLKNILGWTNATPEKRWTKRGAKKAIASWCARDIANKNNLKTQTTESRYVKCRNPEKHPPCNTTWNLVERPNCPRCGWKYEALND